MRNLQKIDNCIFQNVQNKVKNESLRCELLPLLNKLFEYNKLLYLQINKINCLT